MGERAMRADAGLLKIGEALKRTMGDASRGPLIAARAVAELVDDWDKYKAEAGGQSVAGWLVGLLGPGRNADFFLRRADAVDRVGEHARRIWDHHAIVWAVSQFPDEISLKRLDREVIARTHEHGGNPLPKTTVIRISREIGLMRPRESKRVCGRCQELEEAMRAAGVKVPD